MKTTGYDRDRKWAEVAQELETVERLNDYGAELAETGKFRLKLTLLDAKGNEEVFMSTDSEDEGILPMEFWIKVHKLIWKYSAAHEKALKREMSAMALRK